jgi:hypothetical protein
MPILLKLPTRAPNKPPDPRPRHTSSGAARYDIDWRDFLGAVSCPEVCAIILPFVLVYLLARAVRLAAIETAHRVRYVSPAHYAASRSLRASGRAFAIITYIVCVGAGIWAAVGITIAVLGVAGGTTHWPALTWTIPAAAVGAILAGAINVSIRRAAVSLENIWPINRETARSVPVAELLVRASGAPHGRMRGELLRAAFPHVQSGHDLLRASDSRAGHPDDTLRG